jgi:hypothetical protein
MKTNLFIIACFLSIIILNSIPIGTKTESFGEIVYVYNIGLLPNNLIFSLICIVITFIITLLTIQNLKSTIKGQLKIKRSDFNLKPLYINLLIWGLLILISKIFLSNILYLFQWTSSYFFITVIMIFVFYMYIRRYIRITKPDFISFDKQSIIIKNFLQSSKRNLNELTTIDYDLNSNSIELRFKEGLKNISLSLTDYEINDLIKLTEELSMSKGEELLITDNFKNTFNNLNIKEEVRTHNRRLTS